MPGAGGRSGERAAGGRRAGAECRRWSAAAALAAALLAAPACSGGDDGGGLLSFGRRESPAVDSRFSAGSRTDQLVLDGGTARRIAGFELTRARIDRWLQAQDHLSLIAEQDPSVRRLLEGHDGGRGPDDPEAAIDEAIGRLESHGAVLDALALVGSSPAEFVLAGLAMHQAFLASTPSAPERLRRLAARNLRVMQRHEALFQRDRGFDPTRYAYVDSLDWYAPYDTTVAAGDLYDPYAPYVPYVPYDPYAADTTDSLALPDSMWDSVPPPDTLPRPIDSLVLDSLARVRLPVVDTLRLPPPVPPPARRDSARPAAPPPVRPPPTLPPMPPPSRPDTARPPP